MSGVPWGGSEELWSRAALRLKEQGHQVTASVVWWPELSGNLLELERRGIKLEKRKPGRPNFSSRVWRRVKSQILIEEEKEFQWLRLRRPDLVVISQGGNVDGVDWMNFCGKAALPFVSIVQCNVDWWFPEDEYVDRMAQAYRSAQSVYFVSRHNLNCLECQIGEQLPNASIVWNPCNVSLAQPPAWPQEDGEWKLACVARLDPGAKGQDTLLRVLALDRWQDRPVEVNFYGGGTRERLLKKLAASLQLENVQFHGHVADPSLIWHHNHLLVLPSRCEGLPLALVEAMWCARPAVVTNVGGNAEICVDGETGFVAEAPTVDSFGKALEHAWERRQEWQAMGQRARRRAELVVPRDPVGDFCNRLLAGMENGNAAGDGTARLSGSGCQP
jgi:glycosyltransferase involved in cell wall biosynthesis